MTRYSVQPRDRIFAKVYRFSSFVKNMGKSIGKNMDKNLSSKYSQKFLDHLLNNLLRMHLTLFQKEQLKKTAERARYSIGNKIADKITKVSKTSK